MLIRGVLAISASGPNAVAGTVGILGVAGTVGILEVAGIGIRILGSKMQASASSKIAGVGIIQSWKLSILMLRWT